MKDWKRKTGKKTRGEDALARAWKLRNQAKHWQYSVLFAAFPAENIIRAEINYFNLLKNLFATGLFGLCLYI